MVVVRGTFVLASQYGSNVWMENGLQLAPASIVDVSVACMLVKEERERERERERNTLFILEVTIN